MTVDPDDKNATSGSPRLVRLQVLGLLDHFDHVVDFPEPWEYVILHGPNGVGKTKLLELVSMTFSSWPGNLATVPFKSASFQFAEGDSLSLNVFTYEPAASDPEEDGPSARMVKLTYVDGSGGTHEWVSPPRYVTYGRQVLQRIAEVAPVRRLRAGAWRDIEGQENLSDDELFERYSHLLGIEEFVAAPVPPQLVDFLKAVRVYLIETQRLFVDERMASTLRGTRYGSSRRASRVSEHAGNLAQKINHALTTNSTTSQQLERSFPRRLLERGIPDELATQEKIRLVYDRQRELRNELSEIGILDTGEDLPLPTRELDTWERAVLSTYLEDAEKKLETFQDLSTRATLFRDIINSRFRYKEMRLDRRRGFYFVTDNGRTDLSPAKLSSGEQHELVLVYDLIFNVHQGTLVLVDEPEISLHVGWQQRFLSDISQIAHVNNLRFILATHSPQIIHKSWSRTVRLTAHEE
jgi:energy-coupling factor transporter ATP-binding protein EcfA2